TSDRSHRGVRRTGRRPCHCRGASLDGVVQPHSLGQSRHSEQGFPGLARVCDVPEFMVLCAKETMMREAVTAAAAAAAGAAAMYYLDPMTGRRRRAIVRDRPVGLSHEAGPYALAQGRRAADHLRGAAARGRAMLWRSPPASDAQLRERIRSRLGRISSRPRAIEVDVDQGCVCLRGVIAADEVGPLLTLVSSLPGVERVDNLLIPDEPPDLPEGSAHATQIGRAA